MVFGRSLAQGSTGDVSMLLFFAQHVRVRTAVDWLLIVLLGFVMLSINRDEFTVSPNVAVYIFSCK